MSEIIDIFDLFVSLIIVFFRVLYISWRVNYVNQQRNVYSWLPKKCDRPCRVDSAQGCRNSGTSCWADANFSDGATTNQGLKVVGSVIAQINWQEVAP